MVLEKDLVGYLCKISGEKEENIYRSFRKQRGLFFRSTDFNLDRIRSDIVTNTLLDWEPFEEGDVIKNRVEPISYSIWQRFRGHKGRKFTKQELPFFSFERLELLPARSSPSYGTLIKTINPQNHKPFLDPNQKKRIQIDGFREAFPFMKKSDLLNILNFLILKEDVFEIGYRNFRDSYFKKISTTISSKPFCIKKIDSLDFMLALIRFNMEILPYTVFYIERVQDKKKYFPHFYYDFVKDFKDKDLNDMGDFIFRCSSGLPELSLKYFNVFLAADFDLDVFYKPTSEED